MGRLRVPNVNLFDFKFLLGNYGKVLCSAGNELQQNSNASCKVIKGYSISQNLWYSSIRVIVLKSGLYHFIPTNFFWDISVRFLSWDCWNFWRRHDHFQRFPKKSEVFRRRPKSAEGEVFTCFSLQKSEIARKVLSFIHFTHGFRSLHGSELTYFWKLCQARQQQLNQAWEICPQAWDQSFQPAGVRVGRYII